MSERKDPVEVPPDILPGDIITIIRPFPTRNMVGEVIGLAAKDKQNGKGCWRYKIQVGGMVMNFYVPYTSVKELAGQGFMGRVAQFPTEYRIEPNLERRLAMSIEIAKEKRK